MTSSLFVSTLVLSMLLCVLGWKPTGDPGDQTQGSEHSEGPQRLHVKAPALLRAHAHHQVDGVDGKGEEAAE